MFSIAYLKNDSVAKYVFYHYKMQGEGAASYDKYGSIFLYGNMLIMYLEEPVESGRRHNRIIPENNLPGYGGNLFSDCVIRNDSKQYWQKI